MTDLLNLEVSWRAFCATAEGRSLIREHNQLVNTIKKLRSYPSRYAIHARCPADHRARLEAALATGKPIVTPYSERKQAHFGHYVRVARPFARSTP